MGRKRTGAKRRYVEQPRYLPSPAEIAQGCEAIQRRWTQTERWFRAAWAEEQREVELPRLRSSDLRGYLD